jgi:NRAMP (natural resistance-associated macrophage protein)-like metal ion transporter
MYEEKKEGGKFSFVGLKTFFNRLGPGIVTGAADDDPSGIATYSQAGASYGFRMLWLSVFSLPLMALVQEMCARIGLVTGEGLASNIKKHFSRRTLLICTVLLFIANIFNIGADLGAMAKAVQLLVPMISFPFLVVAFGVLTMVLEIYITYKTYSSYLKYLTFALFSYVITAFFIHVPWGNVLFHTVIPTLKITKDELLLVCAILGTTISPYLFFWQTAQEVEEEIARGDDTLEKRRADVTDHDITIMRADVWSGMVFSNIVMFFIIMVCGATIFSVNGGVIIRTAADAASALRPLAGNFAYVLFTLGIVGTGLLALPILAGSCAYALAESFDWAAGLSRKPREAVAFYAVIVFAIGVGILLNFVGLDPMQALLYSAVANGLVAPIMLFFIVSLSSKRDVMGVHKNTTKTQVIGWIVVLLMGLSAVGALWAMV